jgi:hypothetical protein
MITMLLLVTNYGFQGYVGGRVFMMKEPVVIVSKFRFLSHIFSQVSQNITVKLRVDHSVRRNRFTMNNPLHVDKNDEHALR